MDLFKKPKKLKGYNKGENFWIYRIYICHKMFTLNNYGLRLKIKYWFYDW